MEGLEFTINFAASVLRQDSAPNPPALAKCRLAQLHNNNEVVHVSGGTASEVRGSHLSQTQLFFVVPLVWPGL